MRGEYYLEQLPCGESVTDHEAGEGLRQAVADLHALPQLLRVMKEAVQFEEQGDKHHLGHPPGLVTL